MSTTCGAPAGCSAAFPVARRADVIFVGIGPLGTQSPIFKDGFINQAQMDELTARGGIGEIMGALLMPKAAWLTAKSTE
jgi:DNA-binding transcriptional regulator LsrR (DeoR family)